MKFTVYKGKYAFSGLFWPLLVLTSIPFVKNGLTALLLIQTGINACLIMISFSDIAVKKIPLLYNTCLLVLGIAYQVNNSNLLLSMVYAILIYATFEITNLYFKNKRTGKKVFGGSDSIYFALSVLLLVEKAVWAILLSTIMQLIYKRTSKKKNTDYIMLGPFLAICIYTCMTISFYV